jgi:cation transport regulator ChaB
MPKTKEDLPGTLKRSPAKAQRTYAETLDAAEEQYHD